ncbi:hypothetical protein ACP26L_31870 [Paenibacillus sp. S-38]|uniref:hypothetical protein n=1 Tax=Paenibacillus sp. S-38 TaxID=3416710 RepID=UPI003CE6BBEA
MKSKKIVVIASICAVCFGGAFSVNAALDNKVTGKEHNVSYDMITYDDIDQLSKDTSLIVEVNVTKNIIEKQITTAGNYQETYMQREVKINKVYKNEANKTLNKVINIIEPFHYVDNGVIPGKTLVSAEKYEPLKENSKYVLFLNWSEERQAYWIHSVYYGKVNLDDTDEFQKTLYANDEKYKKVVEGVRSKFKNITN